MRLIPRFTLVRGEKLELLVAELCLMSRSSIWETDRSLRARARAICYGLRIPDAEVSWWAPAEWILNRVFP